MFFPIIVCREAREFIGVGNYVFMVTDLKNNCVVKMSIHVSYHIGMKPV